MNDLSFNQQNNDYNNYINNSIYADSGNYTELSTIDEPKDDRQKKSLEEFKDE